MHPCLQKVILKSLRKLFRLRGSCRIRQVSMISERYRCESTDAVQARPQGPTGRASPLLEVILSLRVPGQPIQCADRLAVYFGPDAEFDCN